MLFSEPKIPQYCCDCATGWRLRVSVLFSEPKIPQSFARRPLLTPRRVFQCSSASRKFLNARRVRLDIRDLFSFSALQRAENSSITPARSRTRRASRFSALQRAENSSMWRSILRRCARNGFQCSSASRKFLNNPECALMVSMRQVSVLFSEPKIPQ